MPMNEQNETVLGTILYAATSLNRAIQHFFTDERILAFSKCLARKSISY
jgi:hypothetical protein